MKTSMFYTVAYALLALSFILGCLLDKDFQRSFTKIIQFMIISIILVGQILGI